MSNQDFTILGLRLLAVYAWLQALGYFASGTISMMMLTVTNLGKMTILVTAVAFSPPVILFVAGLLLFRFSQQLAKRMTVDSMPESPTTPDARRFAVIAFGAAGLIGFFMALPRAFQLVTRWFQILQQDSGNPTAMSAEFLRDLGSILGTALQLGLSFALVLGAQKFTEWWWQRQRLQS